MTWHDMTSHDISSNHIAFHHITSHHITSHRITSHRFSSHHINNFMSIGFLFDCYLYVLCIVFILLLSWLYSYSSNFLRWCALLTWNAIVLLLYCHCVARAMPSHCYDPAIVLLLYCYWIVIALLWSGYCIAIVLLLDCHCIAMNKHYIKSMCKLVYCVVVISPQAKHQWNF